GDKTEGLQGGGDFWIVKLDSTGSIEWQNTIGGIGDDGIYWIQVQETSDGGYILGGTSSSSISGDKSEALKGVYDYWVIKLDSAGAIEWEKTVGGDSYDWFTS